MAKLGDIPREPAELLEIGAPDDWERIEEAYPFLKIEDSRANCALGCRVPATRFI